MIPYNHLHNKKHCAKELFGTNFRQLAGKEDDGRAKEDVFSGCLFLLV
jgi:hypothetical protein